PTSSTPISRGGSAAGKRARHDARAGRPLGDRGRADRRAGGVVVLHARSRAGRPGCPLRRAHAGLPRLPGGDRRAGAAHGRPLAVRALRGACAAAGPGAPGARAHAGAPPRRRRRAMKRTAAAPLEPWNRLDPGTTALDDRPFNWLLVTDREAHQLYEGYVPPRVK